jgi:diadenosine tetraphosphate (Ap4A) HIT family hydrolase
MNKPPRGVALVAIRLDMESLSYPHGLGASIETDGRGHVLRSPKMSCPFCSPDPSRIVEATEFTRTISDEFPVTPGHTLITTVRHVADFFDVTPEECSAFMEALWRARDLVQQERHPDGFNVGVNVGEPAGQTVQHVHIHLIPRYKGDVPNPRGGVRGVIPGKADY